MKKGMHTVKNHVRFPRPSAYDIRLRTFWYTKTMFDKHEIVALKKISDPFSKPYPLWHITTFERIKDILTMGLISAKYAKKIGKSDFKRNFDSTWNEDTISLMSNTSSRKATAPDIAVLVNPRIEAGEANGANTKKDINRPIPKEVLVKDMIRPEEFIGLVIGEVGYDFELEKYVKPIPLGVDKVIEVIKSINPIFSLPVYFKGKLVWPK